jgi:hypothetical protein
MSKPYSEIYLSWHPSQYELVDYQVYKEMLLSDKLKIENELKDIKLKLDGVVDDYVIQIIQSEYNKRLHLIKWLLDDVFEKIKELKNNIEENK